MPMRPMMPVVTMRPMMPVVAVAVASDDMHRESLPVSNAVAVALDAAVVLISTVLVPVATTERDLVASQLPHPEALPA